MTQDSSGEETGLAGGAVPETRSEPPASSAFDGYARLYGPLAVVSASLVFVPPFDDVVDVSEDGLSSSTSTFGTLWEMAERTGGGVSALAILLAFVLTALLVAATFRPRSSGLPAAIAVFALPIVVMLITKPETGDPAPPLSAHGTTALVLGVAAVVLGVVHAIHYAARKPKA